MIPHTPLLLVGAAHAIARHASHMRREHPRLPCSLEFVQAIGATTHEDLHVGRSSWPLAHVTSVPMLREVALRRGQVRQRAEVGDLLVFRDQRRAVADEPYEVGIVLEIVDQPLETTGTIRHCLLATARAEGETMIAVVTVDYWCDTRGRDLAIRWYATADDIERAA